jgi:hypothetical protein
MRLHRVRDGQAEYEVREQAGDHDPQDPGGYRKHIYGEEILLSKHVQHRTGGEPRRRTSTQAYCVG